MKETFAAMQEEGMLLLIHGEVTDQTVDVFDREAAFVERTLKPLVQSFPDLKIVMEHCTSRVGVEFVKSAGKNVAATITAHHLLTTRSDIFQGGICPHLYCLPICKTEEDRQALLQAATSGNPKFFAGSDSAPHPQSSKERFRGCAGVYTGHATLEVYATAFESVGRLDKLNDFVSRFGAEFYGIPLNNGTVKLKRESW